MLTRDRLERMRSGEEGLFLSDIPALCDLALAGLEAKEYTCPVCGGKNGECCIAIDGNKPSVAALVEALGKARDIYRWMTGSPDFAPGGQAEAGWKKTQADRDLIDAILANYKGAKP